MTAYEFYCEMKGWQTAIGSVFGFFALMFGALFNFHLNRRRDAALRADEVLSVSAALYGEIRLLRKELGRVARAVGAVHLRADGHSSSPIFDKHFLERYALSDPILYKALAPKLGLLSADIISGITEFYKDFQEAKESLPLLVDDPDRTYSYGSSVVLVPARDAIINILPTLARIEVMASFPRAVEDIKLSDAELAIEIEQEWASEPPPD